ncbi:DNA-binding response regulator [Patiriisocius marinistellae]|uniref:DNA-binding response regulator n=1 Tax=Patiriisocius marinistellae TaxID=2494560 RepID=A0A5J4FYC4_9FLAO|nr:response regulator transcription factor [Patiriisocius marinistellae]GEQ86184.1 DNA-binding response regulator [Patiriisocius marinistellae]
MTSQKLIKIVIVDDHQLFASSLMQLIKSLNGFDVLFFTENGKTLKDKLNLSSEIPDVILLDINMPVMNGPETMEWLHKEYPTIKVLALSMEDEQLTVLEMLRKGANGYLLKDIHPEELEKAMYEVHEKGFYHTEHVSQTLINSIGKDTSIDEIIFKEKELVFIKLCCTEMTYKEIAEEMFLSPKTIDGYRQALFQKLDLRNRVGLVMYALKNNLFHH